MTAAIHFPSCWDGVHYDSTDHKSHVAWPMQNGEPQPESGDCPATHPYQFPLVFMEIGWQTELFNHRWSGNPGDWPFVLSNGDTSGFGLHADFANGWEPGILQAALEHCYIGNDGGDLGNDACFEIQSQEQYQTCTAPVRVAEPVNFIQTLPGRQNSIPVLNPAPVHADTPGLASNYPGGGSGSFLTVLASNASGAATVSAPFASALASVAMPPPSAISSPSAVVTASASSMPAEAVTTSVAPAGACPSNTALCGGTYLGCYLDPVNPTRALPIGPITIGNHAVTNTACIAYCARQNYAFGGTENGGECYCGTTLPPTKATGCNMPCEGDADQICGGTGALTLFAL